MDFKFMQKVIIKEKERGLMFKDGKFQRMLEPGKYHFRKNVEVEILNIESPLVSKNCSSETLLRDENIAKNTDVFEIKEGTLGLYFRDGVYVRVLHQKKHIFWNIDIKNEVKIVDLSDPKVSDDVPRYILEKLQSMYFQALIEVADYQKCLLFYNNKMVDILNAGSYYFWRTDVNVTSKLFDTRLTNMSVNGQEVLTLDKVTIRVNLTVNYRITDCVKMYLEIDDYKEQIHIIAQMALRDYVGKHKLDEILTSKNEMSEFVFSRFKEKEKSLYIEVSEAGVKDIILPGDIRSIMNTVLIAEKKAQASIITRREEVASTRSLLNTAKLMDENKTLYRLKELEYIERIAQYVKKINLNSSGDVLSQLVSLVHKEDDTN